MLDKNEQISNLTELNEDFENYFRNTIIPQLFVDGDLILRKFTPPAMKHFKLKEGDLGKPMTEVIDNFRFPTIIDNITQVISSGHILEKEIQTIDKRWYQMNILPYLQRLGKKTNGVIITFVEITSRIRDLKEQEKLITEHELLLDTISHDIKNHFTALAMTIELLKKSSGESVDRISILVDRADDSLNEMKEVIFDLVDSRLEKHKYEAVEEILDLENILEDVKLTLAQQIHETKAVIISEINASEITFARRKLRSIIYNLVNNSLKYSFPGRIPHILIESYKEENYLVISVADNGIGINPENQESIFEKYYRLRNSVEGNGIGLYLVREALKTVDGKITVESQLNKGSVFKVFLKL